MIVKKKKKLKIFRPDALFSYLYKTLFTIFSIIEQGFEYLA